MSNTPPANEPRYPDVNPRPRTRPVVPSSPPPAVQPGPKTIKVIENGKLKNRPTGDHPEGYGRPPVSTQFKPGSKPGPGRPKGSKSQDSLLKAELLAKQTVRENGRSRTITKRELLTKVLVNGPLEKRNHKELMILHNEARRFFPEASTETADAAASDLAADRQVLRQWMEHLQFGEPASDGADPLADMATEGPDLGQGDGDAWNEGDWNAVAPEPSDDDR